MRTILCEENMNCLSASFNDVESETSLSKMASGSLHEEDSPYFAGWEEYRKNPYDEKLNPHGVIQMGLAENTLSFDLMEKWLKKYSEVTITSEHNLDSFKDLAINGDYHGLLDYRKGVTYIMEALRGNRVKFDHDRIVNTAGASAANEVLMFCLADPGDVFLVPSPYDPAFDRDLSWRAEVEIEPIHCHSSNNFQITKSEVESAFKRAEDLNKKVKGMLITNPCNPLGTTSSAETLKMLLAFADKKKIHLVCDENYAGSVFNYPEFHSIADIVAEENYSLDNVHIVYSLSKEMDLPGFRAGAIYSYNDAIVTTARRMSSFTMISTQTQHLLSTMLSDQEFVSYYMAENKKRLQERHGLIVSGLRRGGMKILEGNAGLFCWVDMSPLLPSNDREGETELWKRILYEAKLNISPGSCFKCMEPGWFRVCFAEMNTSTMEAALERLQKFAEKYIKSTH